jgi:hypothetical protein
MALVKLTDPPPTQDPVLREYLAKQKKAIDDLQRVVLELAVLAGVTT